MCGAFTEFSIESHCRRCLRRRHRRSRRRSRRRCRHLLSMDVCLFHTLLCVLLLSKRCLSLLEITVYGDIVMLISCLQ